ncbi:hypothetical protein IQ22_00436 [Pseudomonas duriflava]|uniref:Uncharacterized protein n=1 Tax=Pseudomonas duriflava TaxID=459528 RepID=A0A562QPR3_9PSED|nr:hypothetical protein [Pseudomonas duriflava]TWI58724.1 hypothetical protein IQ22_00436 [Pseudomonas duriflava]
MFDQQIICKNRRDECVANTRIYKGICSNQAQFLCFFASFLCEKHQKKANEILGVKLVAFNGKLLLYTLMAIDARSFVYLDSLRMIFAVSLWSVPQGHKE